MQNFRLSGEISLRWNFTKFVLWQAFLLKVYKVLAKKAQSRYVSWYWRVVQNLNKNQFVVSKMTRNWWILIWALKTQINCNLTGPFRAKYITFDLKKYRGVIIHDTEKSCKIESCKNWLVVWKITWRNWQMTRELENRKYLHFNGLLLTKVYNVCAKKVQRSYVWWHWILMGNLKENLTCVFKNDMRSLANFHWRTFESLKIGTLMESFYPK